MKLTAEKDIAAKIAAAKARLVMVETRPSAAAALGAAALAAMAALLMAGVVIVGAGAGRTDRRDGSGRLRRQPSKRQASSAAFIGARALCRVSAYSAAGSLSATTPAPAWTKMRLSANRAVRRVMQMSASPPAEI